MLICCATMPRSTCSSTALALTASTISCERHFSGGLTNTPVSSGCKNSESKSYAMKHILITALTLALSLQSCPDVEPLDTLSDARQIEGDWIGAEAPYWRH